MRIKKVTHIQLEEKVPVYDLTVDKYHNFCLSNGIVAHNSARAIKFPNQTVLPLKGKLVNTLKVKNFIDNEEIQLILTAIGYDLEASNPIDKLECGKILLLSDSDPDGPLHADTKVKLVNGKSKTIKELAEQWDIDQKPFEIYSKDVTLLKTKKAIKPRITCYSKKAIKLTVFSSLSKECTSIICTPEHKWGVTWAEHNILPTTEYKGVLFCRADELKVGTILISDLYGYNIDTFVIEIEHIEYEEEQPFYCLTVPSTGNFMVEDCSGNGILSSNCHINTLELTFFYTLCPALFHAGLVYVVKGPRYQCRYKDEYTTAYTLQEMKEKLPKGATMENVSYLKGWGEVDAAVLKDIAFSKGTRQLIQIKPPTKKQMQEFELLMGQDTAYRKQFFNL